MITAYRFWRIVRAENKIQLMSTFEDYIWKPGPNLASCSPSLGPDVNWILKHPATEKSPVENCRCGIYALKDISNPETLLRHAAFFSLMCRRATPECHWAKPFACRHEKKPSPPVPYELIRPHRFSHSFGDLLTEKIGHISGAVLLSGKIIEGEKGYRAEKAEIDVLFSNYVPSCLLKELSQMYRVPIVENPDLPDFKELLSYQIKAEELKIKGRLDSTILLYGRPRTGRSFLTI